MAASRSDQNVLSQDAGFIGRVRASMIAISNTVMVEGWTIAFHRERQTYAVGVLNAPDNYKGLFANVLATDTSIIADATVGGTVPLNSGNVAAQSLLVTDAHIDAAASAFFNSFFRTPAN